MTDKKQIVQDYLEYIYEESLNDEMYAPDVIQSRIDFSRGFDVAKNIYESKWINIEDTLPNDERTVLIKVKDYRRPEENSTEVCLGYLEGKLWLYSEGGIIDSGLGWHIIQWMEIPE